MQRFMILAGVLLLGCGKEESPKPTPKPMPEPVDLVVTIEADAPTMKEMAKHLTKSCGIPFRLAPEVDPDRKLRDPFQVFLPKQNVK